jgi:hypothetical protein
MQIQIVKASYVGLLLGDPSKRSVSALETGGGTAVMLRRQMCNWTDPKACNWDLKWGIQSKACG